jgi:hypothetical protein
MWLGVRILAGGGGLPELFIFFVVKRCQILSLILFITFALLRHIVAIKGYLSKSLK